MSIAIKGLMGGLIALPLAVSYLGEEPTLIRDPCEHGIVVEENAELLNGGSRYRLEGGPYCKSPLRIAHDDHDSRYGGTFFMARNGVHHVEFIYSEQCGAQVVLYNAYTQEVHAAEQIQGMVKMIPDDESQPERLRFLSPSKQGILLGADIGRVQRPFEMEFQLQFPYRVEPDRFNVYISK